MNKAARQLLLVVSVLLTLGMATSVQGANTPWGEGESRGEDLVISLATFSPGDSVESWFGHSGLVVEDRRLNQGRLYNYGMFNFDRDMLLRFAMGRLWFWVAPTSVSRTYQFYASMDRDVRVLELNLPPERRLEVARFLSNNVRPENREYLYEHYDDNCATRLRDIIDLGVGGQFGQALYDAPGRYTLREHTRRHSGHFPPMDWVLMFAMNDSIDGPTTVWQEMFLPEELERQVVAFEWVDENGEAQPLVLRRHVLYEAVDRQPVPEEPPLHWPYWLLLGLFLGGLGLVVGRFARARAGRSGRVVYALYQGMAGVLLGALGLVLGIMALGTDHSVTYWNQNLFWANPLTLGVLFLAFGVLRGKVRARRRLVFLWTGLVGLSLLGVLVQILGIFVPTLYQDTTMAMALIVPLLWGAAASAWMVDGELTKERTPSGRDGGEGERET